ncbi:TetR/AcrR family transcriptional regulator [uncultured Prevotella sp.]|uniref:TetR/AcrR family transcriptional regulator n=1 Tax=uncultured Prevotella sp. TaxID=159272 RepID=UPI0025F4249A|nr:TetR/AcrR family transcriptional regulator [uncultured Prevotella sp.]
MQEIKIISAYRQSLKTRILEAASDAFSQKGIKSVRMDDIAQSLNISKRTLYEIYENKEVLLYECLKTSKARAQEEMTFIAAQRANVMDIILDIYRSKMSQLQKINPQFYSDLEKYPQLQSFLEEQHDKDRTKLKDFLRRGIEEGYFKGDINVDIIANVFDAINEYMKNHKLYTEFPLEQLFNNMLFVTIRGICTQKGVAVIDTFLTDSQD